MENDLEKLFDKLQETFDTNEPKDGHTNRFLKKLEAQDSASKLRGKPTSWRRPLAIAASIAVLFAVGIFVVQKEPSVKEQLAEISPEAANTEFYFANLIEDQVKMLQKESSPETQRIIEDTMGQLLKLKNNYDSLEKDLLAGGNSKLILSAMITNFQTRIDLLQEVLDQVETIKNLKKSNDENYTI